MVFLAGTVASSTWRTTLSAALMEPSIMSKIPKRIALVDPVRKEWDAKWSLDPELKEMRKQCNWEKEMQEGADMIVFWFGARVGSADQSLRAGVVGTR